LREGESVNYHFFGVQRPLLIFSGRVFRGGEFFLKRGLGNNKQLSIEKRRLLVWANGFLKVPLPGQKIGFRFLITPLFGSDDFNRGQLDFS
jgi:hypothetical protein